jgi:hypothetical protein
MFGYFQFAQPQFADAPFFPVQPSGGGSNGGGEASRHNHHHERRTLENRIEITLLAFLNTQP